MTQYAENTQVASDRSRAEIESTLRRYHASGFMYGWEGNRAMIAFQMHDRRIRFDLPMPDPADPAFTETPTGRERSPAHIALPNGQTVGHWMRPQIEQVYQRGEMPAMLPAPDSAG